MSALSVDDFDFFLPPELIAQHPPTERGDSRLLHVAGKTLCDQTFRALPDFLRTGDLLVFNDTRVIKARFFGHKESGGQVEVMLERILDERQALCQIRASKAPKPGSHLRLANAFDVVMRARAGKDNDLFVLELRSAGNFWEMAETYGQLPLPPYIEHPADAADETRYQTVYARAPGAVAAPTAGLHFTDDMLALLRQKGINSAFVTLHVGAGTYRPVRAHRLSEHRMHSERYEIPVATAAAVAATRAAGGRVIAIGTTSLRALESAAQNASEIRAGEGETDIFITPGYRFKAVDRLLTNFHLPKSTLLMLVSAFAGHAAIRAAYAHAVATGYRFFSYGDAMLLERSDAI
ncbi:tRNA preQ1(34) S-adenosylmethionine ribosyltransferase-isomerase QueA [Azonexus sp.]|uniref:tRNA preQ1(34) S-adenosylmethionine ribosyltransferase-isomerase QueA n=1 Tax=Azonexus sp. TaxID=1872668 RepID=UPI0039E4C961